MNIHFKSKDGKVTIILRKLIEGIEIYVFEKKFGTRFNINGKEIHQGDSLFFERTSLSEGEEFLQRVGFVREDN